MGGNWATCKELEKNNLKTDLAFTWRVVVVVKNKELKDQEKEKEVENEKNEKEEKNNK